MPARNPNVLPSENIVVPPPSLPSSPSLSPLAINDRLLMPDQLVSIKGIDFSRHQLRRLVEAGKFPKPVRISDQRVAWRESDINEWIASRPIVGSKDDPKRADNIETGKRLNEALNRARDKKLARREGRNKELRGSH